MIYTPTFTEVLAVSRSHGKASEAPHLWDGLMGRLTGIQGGGKTWYDVSGYDRLGTLTSMAPATDWVMTDKGPALDFDGSDDWIDIPAIGNGWSAISIAARIKADTFAVQNWKPIVSRDDEGSTANDVFNLLARDGSFGNEATFRIYTGAGNEQGTARSGVVLSTGVWYHVVGTYDGANVRIYLDGALQGTTADTGALATETTRIAIASYSNQSAGYFFDGQIDDVGVWDRALLPNEVEQFSADPVAMLRLRSVQVRGSAGGGPPPITRTSYYYNLMLGS